MTAWVAEEKRVLHVMNAERMRLLGTPALTRWLDANAEKHGLVMRPHDDAGPFVRRFRMAGDAAMRYQLGGRAVFIDRDENRLYVGVLSAPKTSINLALVEGWVVVNGVRCGTPVQNGARMAQRKIAAGLALVAKYGHLLGADAWVQVPYGERVKELRVKDLRSPDKPTIKTVKVSGQVWSHRRRAWANSTPRLSPGKDYDIAVVSPSTPLDIRRGHAWVSLHDRQTHEALYRFTPEQWAAYERAFPHD